MDKQWGNHDEFEIYNLKFEIIGVMLNSFQHLSRMREKFPDKLGDPETSSG